MLKHKSSEYVWLGSCIRYLRDAREGAPIHGDGAIAYNLRRMSEECERLGFSVSLQAMLYTELPALKKVCEVADEDAKLTKGQAADLLSSMRIIWTTVLAEADGVEAYTVSEKRVNTAHLLDSPSSLLANEVFDSLPSLAQRDFSEACRCIAFELATAAAFHLMRCVEAALRAYYRDVIKRDRLKEPLMWGPMVKQLEAKKTNKPPAPLIASLDNMREHFRNPTQHPEAEYDILRAEDLLFAVMEVLGRLHEANPTN